MSGVLTVEEAEARQASWFAAMFGLTVEARRQLAAVDDEALAAAIVAGQAEVDQFAVFEAFAAGLDRRRAVLASLERLASRPLLSESSFSPGAVDEMLGRAAVAWAARDRGFRKAVLAELEPVPDGFDEVAARQGRYGATLRDLVGRVQTLRNEAQCREYARAGVDPRNPLPGPEEPSGALGEAVPEVSVGPTLPPQVADDYCGSCGSRLEAGHFEGCPEGGGSS